MRGPRIRSLLAVASAVAAVLAFATPAWAAPETEVVQGQYLRIVSTADWEQAAQIAEAPVDWDVTISTEAPAPGEVRIAVSAQGDVDLIADVAVCALAWTVAGCAGEETVLRSAWELPLTGAVTTLLTVPDTEIVHLRLRIALGGADASGRTEVRVHAFGEQEELSVGPDGPALPATGMESPFLAAAVGLLCAATALLLVGKRERKPRGEGG